MSHPDPKIIPVHIAAGSMQAPPLPPRLHRIEQLSHVLSWTCLLLAVVLPLVVIGWWMMVGPERAAVLLGLPERTAWGALTLELTPLRRLLAAGIGAVPVLFLSYAMLQLRRCFQLFAAGRFFAPPAVQGLRGFAGGMLFSSASSLLVSPVLTVLLTYGNGEGGRMFAVSIGSWEVLGLFFAGVVWLIAAVMAEAVRLAEENAAFV